jgi:hypothetical protein
MAEHLLHVCFQILLRIDLINDTADCEHQGLLNSEICTLSSRNLLLVLIEIFNSKSQKFMEIVWLWVFDFLLLFGFTGVLTEVTQQILDLIFRLEKCLGKIILISNVFYWVVIECVHVFLSDKHDGNYCVVEDVFHIRFKLLHCV